MYMLAKAGLVLRGPTAMPAARTELAAEMSRVRIRVPVADTSNTTSGPRSTISSVSLAAS